jgi:hypothetical protein
MLEVLYLAGGVQPGQSQLSLLALTRLKILNCLIILANDIGELSLAVF